MDAALLTTLRVHNPWLDRPEEQQALLAASLPELFVPRQRRLELRPGRAELIVGPRQAGKSTWIREVLSRFEAPVLVLHAEEPRIRELGQSPALALAALSEVLTPETLLLFEEIQHIAEAPIFIKGLVVNASLRLDTVEDSVTVRFVRPWEIDLVLAELEG